MFVKDRYVESGNWNKYAINLCKLNTRYKKIVDQQLKILNISLKKHVAVKQWVRSTSAKYKG